MLIDNPMPTRLTLGYAKGTASFSDIRSDASDESVYEMAQLINSLQSEPALKITRVDRKKILSV